MSVLRWICVDGLVQLVFLCIKGSLLDKLVFCEKAECVERRTFVAETEGKLISSWADCFLTECSVFADNICSVCDLGRAGSLDRDEKSVLPWALEDVDRGLCCAPNDGRLIWVEGGISWLLFWVKCSCEPFKSSCSFLFLLNMSNCSWFHDFTAMFSSFPSLLRFRFNRRSSKEFCFDKLFQISCSKYLALAFLCTSFISSG